MMANLRTTGATGRMMMMVQVMMNPPAATTADELMNFLGKIRARRMETAVDVVLDQVPHDNRSRRNRAQTKLHHRLAPVEATMPRRPTANRRPASGGRIAAVEPTLMAVATGSEDGRRGHHRSLEARKILPAPGEASRHAQVVGTPLDQTATAAASVTVAVVEGEKERARRAITDARRRPTMIPKENKIEKLPIAAVTTATTAAMMPSPGPARPVHLAPTPQQSPNVAVVGSKRQRDRVLLRVSSKKPLPQRRFSARSAHVKPGRRQVDTSGGDRRRPPRSRQQHGGVVSAESTNDETNQPQARAKQTTHPRPRSIETLPPVGAERVGATAGEVLKSRARPIVSQVPEDCTARIAL